MSHESQNKTEAAEDTGVADVRRVREKIAAQYGGNLKKHAAQTTKMVEPLIEKLGLKQGTPIRKNGRRSGTEG
jgi:hypothetical protein